jgi:hypothetical protein
MHKIRRLFEKIILPQSLLYKFSPNTGVKKPPHTSGFRPFSLANAINFRSFGRIFRLRDLRYSLVR